MTKQALKCVHCYRILSGYANLVPWVTSQISVVFIELLNCESKAVFYNYKVDNYHYFKCFQVTNFDNLCVI